MKNKKKYDLPLSKRMSSFVNLYKFNIPRSTHPNQTHPDSSSTNHQLTELNLLLITSHNNKIGDNLPNMKYMYFRMNYKTVPLTIDTIGDYYCSLGKKKHLFDLLM